MLQNVYFNRTNKIIYGDDKEGTDICKINKNTFEDSDFDKYTYFRGNIGANADMITDKKMLSDEDHKEKTYYCAGAYRTLQPGKLEEGKDNPAILNTVAKMIEKNINSLSSERREKGINLCFLSGSSGREESYVLEYLCAKNVRIRNIILVNWIYDKNFINNPLEPLTILLEDLKKNKCIVSYIYVTNYSNIYLDQKDTILYDKNTSPYERQDIIDDYTIDSIISFYFRYSPPSSSVINVSVSGPAVGTNVYEIKIKDISARFSLADRFWLINDWFKPAIIIPKKCYDYENKEGKVIEETMKFPEINEEIKDYIYNKSVNDAFPPGKIQELRDWYNAIVKKESQTGGIFKNIYSMNKSIYYHIK